MKLIEKSDLFFIKLLKKGSFKTIGVFWFSFIFVFIAGLSVLYLKTGNLWISLFITILCCIPFFVYLGHLISIIDDYTYVNKGKGYSYLTRIEFE